jgi:molecular chaperone DnaK (HSP70)
MTVIGIDLGTTNSSVGRLTRQGVELIPDNDRVAIPSVVAFHDGECHVGRLAVKYAARYSETTIFDTKRMLGCSMKMPAIQDAIPFWPFQVVPGENDEILIKITEGEKQTLYHPWEISAKILEKLKKMAEDRIGTPVTEAAISVPAYFTDAQREDTLKAARAAGLHSVRLVNEPSVGAIAYGFETQPTEARTVLVFDFGGGTLDVSLLSIQGKSYSVLAVSGDPSLGGRDFDARLMDLCLEKFQKTGTSRFDPKDPGNARRLTQLRACCEEAKCDLSDSLRADVVIDDFYAGKDLVVQITRKAFESKCEDLFEKILDPIEEVLANSDKKVGDIDDIILIGGSSGIPRVRVLLTRFFGKPPFPGVNPLEAVAKGATIMAAACIGGGAIPKFLNVTCTEICPLPLGVEIVGGRMAVMIRRGHRLPVISHSEPFFTTRHNQTSIDFDVYEGPWLMVRRNRKLGSFQVTGIPPAEANEEPVLVEFHIDRDGVLHVAAKVVSTAAQTNLVVRKTGNLFSRDRVKRTLAEREAEKEIDIREYDEAGRKTTLELLADNFAKFMAKELKKGQDFDRHVPLAERRRLQDLIDELLPKIPGYFPTKEQIQNLRTQLQDGIRKYVALKRKGMPAWL